MNRHWRWILGFLCILFMFGCSKSVYHDVAYDISKDTPASLKEETAGVKSYEAKSAPKFKRPTESGLKAGYSDDNQQFNYYLSFLQKYGTQVAHLQINVEERIIIRVRDNKNRPLANAGIEIFDGSTVIDSGKTYSDGTFLFFPSEHSKEVTSYSAVITVNKQKKKIKFNRQGLREIPVSMPGPRIVSQSIPLDIVFILDTTGSMGQEINRLKDTIDIINLNLSSLSTKPDVRFGMVLYKDKNDEYVTKVIPLTRDLDQFREELNKVVASGGGDTPEDLQAAIQDAMKRIEWNKDGIRLAYVITDAPPHLDYGQTYTYVNAAHDARKAGIKIFTVGTGALDLAGEYVLRQISQYTYAKYIFLTHGERGESEGGRPGSVSHHTGANFQVDKLESIIMRFAKEELSYQSDQPIKDGDAYFQAIQIPDERREETLQKLFDMSISQLIDYAAIQIEKGTLVTTVPLSADKAMMKSNAKYLTEQMNYSLSLNKIFRMVERRDMQKILDELKLQQSGIIDDKKAARLGKLMGASIIITGRVYDLGGNYEVFMKMLRVETGEILSVNKLKVDRKLCLTTK